jgi:lambda family phage minor tail protein L
MTLTADLQKLEPGGLLEFFDLDATSIGGDFVRFHGMRTDAVVVWQGNEYSPWPIQATGFARTSSQPALPKLAVGNVDLSISLLCAQYQDLVGAILTRRRTFIQYLDAVNFDDGNPTADPTQEFPEETWYIERKAEETPEQVVFELCSAMEFQGIMLPGRQIIANFCPWIVIGGYRGPYCGYTGGPVAKEDDTATSDSALDKCGGRLTSCKLRFGENGKLPYGGMPAAGLIRT